MYKLIILTGIFLLVFSGCSHNWRSARQDAGEYSTPTNPAPPTTTTAGTSPSAPPSSSGDKNPVEASSPSPGKVDFDLPGGWQRQSYNPAEITTTKNGSGVILFWISNQISTDAFDLQIETSLQKDLSTAEQKCQYFECPFSPYLKSVEKGDIKFFALVQPEELRESGIVSTVYFKNNLGFYSSLVITDNFEKYLDDLVQIATTIRKEK